MFDGEPEGVMTAGELRCSGCARAPLVGEWATLHAGRGRWRHEGWLCDLCESDPRLSARLGETLRRERLLPGGAAGVARVA
jgi:hypothetical protein